MDDLEREYRVFPKWVGVIGGVFFAALLFWATWGLFSTMSIDIWKVPHPVNGIGLLVTMGSAFVGFYLGWTASYMDWIIAKRDSLWYGANELGNRLRASRAEVKDLKDLLSYVPASTLEWARQQREEALSTAAAEEASARAVALLNPPDAGGVHETI